MDDQDQNQNDKNIDKNNKPSKLLRRHSCCKEDENTNTNDGQANSQDKADKETDKHDDGENEKRDDMKDDDKKEVQKDGSHTNSCCNPPKGSCCDFTVNVDIEELILEDLYADPIRKTCTPVGAQTLTTFTALFFLFTSGVTIGYSAILLPQLRKPGSDIPCDEETTPWIASSASIPMAPGSIIVGYVVEKYGRRTAYAIVCVPIFVGWLFIVCASSLLHMVLGRIITGLCVGYLGPLTAVYVGECTTPKYRGFTLAGGAFAIALGVFTVHLIGTFLHWRITAIIFIILPILGILILRVVPESPIWLISKGKTEEGVKTFFWLRGRGEMARRELNDIIAAQIERNRQPKLTLAETFRSLKRRAFIKPLIIVIIFHATSQFSGLYAIMFYSIDIVTECVGMTVDNYVIMMGIDSVRVMMAVVACILCKMCGRRPLCFASGFLTALAMLGLSLYLYLTQGVESKPVWIPIACLLIYICSTSIALVPMPWMMCGELFPTALKGLGSGLCTAIAYAIFYIVIQSEPMMMINLGNVGTFFVYGLLTTIGTCVLFFILPETMGKSLQEIENELTGVRSISDTKTNR